MTNEERAYAAGLLDGEGSVMICVAKTHERKYRSAVMKVSVTNTFLPVLEWLKERWGGSIAIANRARPQDWKAAGAWTLSASSAARFLEDVQPFVIIKRGQIENALAFQATKRGKGQSRSKLTDADWDHASSFLKRQRELNARGPAKTEEVTR